VKAIVLDEGAPVHRLMQAVTACENLRITYGTAEDIQALASPGVDDHDVAVFALDTPHFHGMGMIRRLMEARGAPMVLQIRSGGSYLAVVGLSPQFSGARVRAFLGLLARGYASPATQIPDPND
jgi:hypothetical protein